MSLKIEWCLDNSLAEKLADLFLNNLEIAYISHSEMIGGIAVSPQDWHKDLDAIVLNSFIERIQSTIQNRQKNIPAGIVICFFKDELVGVANVSCFEHSLIGVLEDIVIASSHRNLGIASQIFDWIQSEMKKYGLKYFMLESGINNKKAHSLFYKKGFKLLSEVFIKNIFSES